VNRLFTIVSVADSRSRSSIARAVRGACRDGAKPGKILTLVMYYLESVVRITSKGQVTIPQRIREQAGLLPNTEVGFEIVRGRVILKPLGAGASRGQRAVAPLRGSLKHLKRSTDELMALTRGED
jgi:AbrB family looped-hinge helix DNA binding protein